MGMPEEVYEVSDGVMDSPEIFVPIQVEKPIELNKSAPVRKAVKRAAGRTGRSAFVDPICKQHPDWEHEDGTVVIANEETHCAKFAHLPGRGRGFYQPGVSQIFKNSASELVKPILLLSLLGAAFYFLTHFLGGGLGGVLRPSNDVCRPASTVSGSSRPTPLVSPNVHRDDTNCGNGGDTTFLHVGPSVTAKSTP